VESIINVEDRKSI